MKRTTNPFAAQAKMLYYPHLDKINQYMKTDEVQPILNEINLTDRCNLACEWCIADNRTKKDSLNTSKVFDYLKDYKRLGGEAVTWSGGGEPTLHKDIEHIVFYASLLDLQQGLMTNGVYSPNKNKTFGEKLVWARFSVDTLNNEKYKQWKGKDLVELVKHNIESLIDYPVRTCVNVNVCKDHTPEEIYDLICYVGEGNADLLQFRPVLPRYFKDEKLEINMDLWEYILSKQEDYPFIVLSKDKLFDVINNEEQFPYKSCEGYHFSFVLQANGDVQTCMYHPNDDRFTFGNINDTPLEEIIKSDKFINVQSFIRNELDMNKECQICCKNNEINKLIDIVRNGYRDDIGFI